MPPTYTFEPTFTPTLAPSPTVTPDCVELEIPIEEITFDPERAAPGMIVTITAAVQNVGAIHTDYTEVYFAYDATPLEGDDDPNPVLIGEPYILEDIAVGEKKYASVDWDTTGLEELIYPVYVFTWNTRPDICLFDYVKILFTVPVELYNFYAVPEDGKVDLHWTTVTEINNIGFHLYRSSTYFDDYEVITDKIIPGAGTSFEKHNYQFTDTEVENGVPYFYKLAMIDHEGVQSWSWTIAGIPQPESACKVQINTWSDRMVYYEGHPLVVDCRIYNPGEDCRLKMQMMMLINQEYAGDLFPPMGIEFAAGTDVVAELLRYDWTGREPGGDYVFLTILSDPETGMLKHIDVNEFKFLSSSSGGSALKGEFKLFD